MKDLNWGESLQQRQKRRQAWWSELSVEDQQKLGNLTKCCRDYAGGRYTGSQREGIKYQIMCSGCDRVISEKPVTHLVEESQT